MKLVRDKIPEIILSNGDTPITTVAASDEYEGLLINKLREEVEEFISSNDVEELCDILEVVYALAHLQGVSTHKLESVRQCKAKRNGKFEDRIVLNHVVKHI